MVSIAHKNLDREWDSLSFTERKYWDLAPKQKGVRSQHLTEANFIANRMESKNKKGVRPLFYDKHDSE